MSSRGEGGRNGGGRSPGGSGRGGRRRGNRARRPSRAGSSSSSNASGNELPPESVSVRSNVATTTPARTTIDNVTTPAPTRILDNARNTVSDAFGSVARAMRMATQRRQPNQSMSAMNRSAEYVPLD